MTSSFGQRLRRLRLATTVTRAPRPHLVGTRWTTDGPHERRDPASPSRVLSCTGLARLAHVDPAYVQHLEAGRKQPSRGVVERIAAALHCSDVERATLLGSAGYWPWPDADDQTTELLVALALAVLDGDYRPLADTVGALTVDGSSAIHKNHLRGPSPLGDRVNEVAPQCANSRN